MCVTNFCPFMYTDHDQPPVSPSRDYLSSRPLPFLPAEPRPQTVATSSLIRSQSLDDLHAPPSNDVDNLFRLNLYISGQYGIRTRLPPTDQMS